MNPMFVSKTLYNSGLEVEPAPVYQESYKNCVLNC